jgi:hypothetical protein
MPHGHCYLWDPGLVRLHVISDFLIAVAYFTIPFTLINFVRRREGKWQIEQRRPAAHSAATRPPGYGVQIETFAHPPRLCRGQRREYG